MAEIHPTRDDAELERWLAIRNEVLPDDKIAIEDVRGEAKAARASHLLAFEDGELVAAGLGIRDPWQPEPRVGPLVPFANRGRGLGSALLAALSRWASANGGEALLAEVELGDEASLAFAERRGFTEVGRTLKVELNLLAPLLKLDPPEGVTIVTWAQRPELVGGIYEVYREGVADIPGEEDAEVQSFDDWIAHDMSGSGDDPESTFVAVAGNEVVGYSKWSLTTAQPHTAHHDLTAVKRAWRGRGIAGALKSAQLAWAQHNCYTSAVTNNEERNAPIRRLNERFGYRPAGGSLLLRGPLQGGTG